MQNVENWAGFAFSILHLSFRVPFFITLLPPGARVLARRSPPWEYVTMLTRRLEPMPFVNVGVDANPHGEERLLLVT